MRSIGPLEITLIIVAIVLVFGVGRLGQVGGALGKSIREFRRERDRKDDPPEASAVGGNEEPAARVQTKASGTRTCPSCGGSMSATAKFCMECGTKVGDFT